MANYSLIENVNQTIADFDDIQSAINEKSGEGTVLDTDPTSTYADKIRAISTGGNYHTINWFTDVTSDNNNDILSLEKYNELLEHLNEPWIMITEDKSYQVTSTSNNVCDSIITISMQDSRISDDNIEYGYYQQNIDIEINSSRIISLIGYYSPNNIIIDTMIQNSLPSVGTISPKMDGVAAVGTSTKYAREDHVHPTDDKITTLEEYFDGKTTPPEINIVANPPDGELVNSQLICVSGTYNPDTDHSVHSKLYYTGLSFRSDNNNTLLIDGDNNRFSAKTTWPLTITLNNGTTEGTDKFTFDGSSAKTLNINTGGSVTLEDIMNGWTDHTLVLSSSDSNNRTGLIIQGTERSGEEHVMNFPVAGYNAQLTGVANDVTGMYAGIDSNANIISLYQGNEKIKLSNSGIGTFSDKVNATNGFYETSDERLKDFYKDIEVDFDKLLQLPTKYFSWKKDQKDGQDAPLMIGTSAQEVQKIYPELVFANENGELSVDYAKLSVICLAAIKELKKELDEIHQNKQ